MAAPSSILRWWSEPQTRWAAPIMLGLMAAVVLMLAANAVSFRRNLDLSRAATSDSRVWTTSQLEVDHKNLLLALAAARFLPPDQAKLRVLKAFDIYYSRVDILNSALRLGDLPPTLRDSLTTAVISRDALADQIDQMDMKDPAALARTTQTVDSLSPLLRQIALDALGYFIDEANKLREREITLWARFLGISLILIWMMAAAMCFALLLRRQLADQITLVQTAANNIRMVYDASINAVIVSDLDGTIVLFNAAAERIFGWSAADILGRNIADTMIPSHRLTGHHRAMKRLQEEGPKSLSGKPKLTTSLDANRREFAVELSIHASRDADGKTLLISFIHDVSERLAYESNLRDARDEARRHAESRTMFLATMSHEMRTPLHGLLASLDLITEEDQSTETRRLLSTARDCALRSVSQINDVLDLIQIDESQEPNTVFSPAKVVAAIVSELDAVARDRNNSVHVTLTGASDSHIWLGAMKTFSRILYNLIGNALKFTENGHVQIDLTFRPGAEGGHSLAVSVKDSGIGISPNDQAHVFDLFFTSTSTQTGRRQKGTGLGLPIARKGVEKMGGQLCLDSVLGVGSRFYFEVPIACATDTVLPSHLGRLSGQPQNFALTCLVVDDNIVNLELTAQMLRQLGCTVLARDNGAAAVAATVQVHFDVVFMDLNMPGGMSGVEATRHIRNLEQIDPLRKAKSQIIALTADTTFGSPSNLAKQGMDFVLHKPVRTPDLVRLLAEVESRQRHATLPKQLDADDAGFPEVFALMGPVGAKRLLIGVVDDLKAVQRGLAAANDPHLQNLLHRAIGSAGMVGLATLSHAIAAAEKKLTEHGHLDVETFALSLACDEAIASIHLAVA